MAFIYPDFADTSPSSPRPFHHSTTPPRIHPYVTSLIHPTSPPSPIILTPPLRYWRPSTPTRYVNAKPLSSSQRLARRPLTPQTALLSRFPRFSSAASMPKTTTKDEKKVKATAPEKKRRAKKEKDPNKPKR